MLLNSPDCRTIGSIPAKATKADELLNLFISPISARMFSSAIEVVVRRLIDMILKLMLVSRISIFQGLMNTKTH